MTIARITTPGLTAIAASVVLLWSCLISEHVLVRRAIREQTQVLREMDQLRQRQRSVPASVPIPHGPDPPQTTRG